MSDTVTVKVGCGMYMGPPRWGRTFGDWSYEPEECGWEGSVQVDRDTWEQGDFEPVRCPVCGSLLDDPSHYEPQPAAL